MRCVICAFATIVAVELLAACSSSSGGLPSPQTVSFAAKSGALLGGALLYVAVQETPGKIIIYPATGYNQPPIGTITSGLSAPHGLYVDQNDNLYAANTGNNTVTVYPQGSTKPSATYSADLDWPSYPIVDAYGDLFASNADGGTVVEYLAGSTTPHQVLQTAGAPYGGAYGMDFDKNGNLYVAYRRCKQTAPLCSGGGSIEEFELSRNRHKVLGMALEDPEGVIVDNKGNILVLEAGRDKSRVAVFPPGAKTPTLTLSVPSGVASTQLAITENESQLFVCSWQASAVYVTGYPLKASSTWALLDSDPALPFEGIALSNGQTF
jgi:hypothetical protein